MIRLSSRAVRAARRLFFLPLVLFLISPDEAWSQETTFTVTVAAKTSQHPFFGQGWPEGYVIGGTEGAELTLVRGRTYVFQMSDVPAEHPFYLSTSASGAGAGAYTDGVTGTGATGNQSLTFTPDDDTPDLLYYQCQSHASMGSRLNIVDDATSSEEERELPRTLTLDQNYPNPFNPSTTISYHVSQTTHVSLKVYDLLGREIAILVDAERHPGSYAVAWDGRDASGMPASSGVYVYRSEADGMSQTRLMTLLK